MIQVLIDADNLTKARLVALVQALPVDEARVIVAGSRRALAMAEWPRGASVHEVEGWQQADLLLAQAYSGDDEPLVLATGDGDFAHLAGTHRGPVLVISDRPASRLRAVGTVIDPVNDGLAALRAWFDAVVDSTWDPSPDEDR